MQKFYHITPLRNVDRILDAGLLPQIGQRSTACGEQIAGIYLFPTRECMEDAAMNWLGEELVDTEFVVLEVELPENIIKQFVVDENVGWEVVCPVPIPTQYISISDIEF